MINTNILPLTFSQLHKPVLADIQIGNVPFILGEAGIGKTSFLEGIAKDLDTKLFALQMNQLADRSDLTGIRPAEIEVVDGQGHVTIEHTQKAFPHATIAEAIIYAKQNPTKLVLLLLGELNRSDASIGSAALSFITARIIGTTTFPKNIRFVVDGNDSGNVTNLDEASKTRFSIYKAIPDLETYFNVNSKLHPYIKSVLTKNPNTLVCRPITANQVDPDTAPDAEIQIEDLLIDDHNFEQLTCPRTITYLSDSLNHFRREDLEEMLANESLQAYVVAKVGNTPFAAELLNVMLTDLATTPLNTTTVTKPAAYDLMLTKQTKDELETYFLDLSDEERSALLIYSVYSRDNIRLQIEMLAKVTDSLTPSDAKLLMMMASNGQVDQGNLRCLLNTDSPITKAFGPTLELHLED